jgi:hypothetical protein
MRSKAGVRDLYKALAEASSTEDVKQIQTVVASYRRLNKNVNAKATTMLVDACATHNCMQIVATMAVDKVKYGVFPTTAEYNQIMAGVLADEPASAVALFEAMVLARAEEPDDASYNLVIEACTHSGSAAQLTAAVALLEGCVVPHSVVMEAKRYPALAAALLAPDAGFASVHDGANAAVKVLAMCPGNCGGDMAGLQAQAEAVLAGPPHPEPVVEAEEEDEGGEDKEEPKE